ncbi:hypothetical protein [Streptomyces sp. NPDC094032]|uniref:hypothetical protein n=1 Tax=Streptomyces sp. NPDC094032 TaxID=3155308 RepID=UPI00331E0E00
MTDINTDICTILTTKGEQCESPVVWEVTPDGGKPYVCCGQHVTAPLMRADVLVPFSARPIYIPTRAEK